MRGHGTEEGGPELHPRENERESARARAAPPPRLEVIEPERGAVELGAAPVGRAEEARVEVEHERVDARLGREEERAHLRVWGE